MLSAGFGCVSKIRDVCCPQGLDVFLRNRDVSCPQGLDVFLRLEMYAVCRVWMCF